MCSAFNQHIATAVSTSHNRAMQLDLQAKKETQSITELEQSKQLIHLEVPKALSYCSPFF